MSAPAPGIQNPMLAWALRYRAMGWRVIPLRGKFPITQHGSEDGTTDEQQIRDWWTREPRANIGLCTGDAWFALDVDPKKGGEESLQMLIYRHGRLPDTLQQMTGGGGQHYLFASPDFAVHNSESKLAQGIDIRGAGGYIVAPPSLHPETKVRYQWDGLEEIERQSILSAPGWLLDWLRADTAGHGGDGKAVPAAGHGGDGKASAVLEAKIPKGKQHSVLVSLAGSMRRRGFGEEEIYAALVVANRERCTEPGPDKNIRRIAASVAKYVPDARADVFAQLAKQFDDEETLASADESSNPQTEIAAAILAGDLPAINRLAPLLADLPWSEIAAIEAECEAALPKFSARNFERAIRPQKPVLAIAGPQVVERIEGPDIRPFPLTDSGNGERMAVLYGDRVHFCFEMDSWLVWDGRRWAPDQVGAVRQMAMLTARELYKQAASTPSEGLRLAMEQWARKSESAAGINATLARFQTQPGIAVSAAQLDAHPWLLNCDNGVLDLKADDIELRPHDRELLLTKLCRIRYDPSAECPVFRRFLDRIMGGSDAADTGSAARLAGFLQRAFGYSLTGDTGAKVAFYFYGASGNNGKTTLLEIFEHILAEYSARLNIDTLLQKPGGVSPSTLDDLAALRGARFVLTSEPEEGQRLRAGLFKQLSAGQGTIKSKRLYERHVEVEATHKLFIEANNLLGVPATDQAFWNRIRAVPFAVTIPDEELDLELPGKLRGEAAGILAWAVRGCAAWKRNGLAGTAEIAAQSAEWRAAADPLREFIDDCCEIDLDAKAPVKAMSEAYERWAEQYGEKYPLNRQKLNEALRKRGCTQDRECGVRTWFGIGLRVYL